MTVKMIKTDSEFLEVVANKITVGEEEWYFMPFYFKKVGTDLFEQVPFSKLPEHVQKHIQTMRGLNL